MIQSAIKEAKQDSVGDSDNSCTAESWNGLHAAQMQVKGGTPDQGLFVCCNLLCCRLPAPEQGRERSKSEDCEMTCLYYVCSKGLEPILVEPTPPGSTGHGLLGSATSVPGFLHVQRSMT